MVARGGPASEQSTKAAPTTRRLDLAGHAVRDSARARGKATVCATYLTSRCRSIRPGRCRRCCCSRRARAARRARRCAAACCTCSTSRSRRRPGAASRRGRSAGALRLLAAFPRTGGPLLVLGPRRPAHPRAGDDALDDAHGRCGGFRDARRAPPEAAAARAGRRANRVDLAGPPPAKPGQLRTLVTHLPQRRRPVRHRLAHPRGNQSRRDQLRPATRMYRAQAPSAGCSSCPRPGGAGASTRRATGSPIRTTRRTRSSARPATSTPPARARHPARGLRLQPRRLVRQRGAARSPPRCPTTTGLRALSGPDVVGVAGRRARRPQRVGVRVGGQQAAPALLAGTAPDGLGPAEALAREFLEPESPSSAAVAARRGRASGCRARRARPRARNARGGRAPRGIRGRGAARAARRPGRCTFRTPDSRRRQARARRGRGGAVVELHPAVLAGAARTHGEHGLLGRVAPGRPRARRDRRRGTTSGSAPACAPAGARRARARARAAPPAASAWATTRPPRATTRTARAPG